MGKKGESATLLRSDKQLMHDSTEDSFKINPYTRWIYDHPERLLPDPTPELLRERMGDPTTAPLIVELGCGSGNFLLQLAQIYPDTKMVGFELRFKRLVKAARKMEKEGLRNVWLMREFGERFYTYFSDQSVDALYINFPDPWPKTAQWKNRMVSDDLLDRIAVALKPSGRFHIKTDHSGYFLHCLSIVRNRTDFRIHAVYNDFHRQNLHGPRIESEFEKMFLSKQKPVFYLVLEKSPSAQKSPVPPKMG